MGQTNNPRNLLRLWVGDSKFFNAPHFFLFFQEIEWGLQQKVQACLQQKVQATAIHT